MKTIKSQTFNPNDIDLGIIATFLQEINEEFSFKSMQKTKTELIVINENEAFMQLTEIEQ